jgi:hypothetical protein
MFLLLPLPPPLPPALTCFFMFVYPSQNGRNSRPATRDADVAGIVKSLACGRSMRAIDPINFTSLNLIERSITRIRYANESSQLFFLSRDQW